MEGDDGWRERMEGGREGVRRWRREMMDEGRERMKGEVGRILALYLSPFLGFSHILIHLNGVVFYSLHGDSMQD